MTKKIIPIFILIALALPQPAFATPTPPPPPAPMLCQIVEPIRNIISIAIAAGGIAFFIMLIWGSITWLTAGANANQATQAQSTFTWAIIGLVLLVASYAILMIIQSFTGVTLTEIKFPWTDSYMECPPL